ncbi:Alpha/beta hydrolase family protein [Spironucleus salmonicida]|uniref:Alpha/beta hydrolase n=1 Tax=Spironucleus salmonicida TaxID=348837 RepID=V6M0V4_9EUKA|nr:Alpha/beta hydrolase family protein [Spironucleus salmonicida]|eukprot:EST46774.1 Alpha/beta hydrolase [Spironucleus salmonicida]
MEFEDVDWSIQLDQLKIQFFQSISYYDSQNDKQPLFFFHGFGQLIESYTPLILYLENEYRVIAPDLPGHGKSEELQSYATESVVSILKIFIQSFKFKYIILCGHSLGGLLAILLNRTISESLVIAITPGGVKVKEGFLVQVCKIRGLNYLLRYFWNQTFQIIQGQVSSRTSQIIPQHHQYKAIWKLGYHNQIQKYVNSQMKYLRDFQFSGLENAYLSVQNGLFILVDNDSYIDSEAVYSLVNENKLGQIVYFNSIHSIGSAIPLELSKTILDWLSVQ